MKRYINYILAAFILAAAMSATSCEKDNPISPVTPVEKPGEEDIYVNVEFQPVVLEGERGSVATASYSVKTNFDSSEPFVLSLKENPYFKLEGKTVTALRKNVSEKDRTDTLLLTHPKLPQFAYKMPLTQKSLPRPENLVDFKCEALKAALVERFDSDYDGEISTDEALAVEEIDIRACGVTDLTGIGAFKKAWKLDARDNDIVDATDVKGMRQLYWLDLKGNHNLRTFDITGCTIYFEHLDFEVTENLKYYLLKNQVQKEPLTIPHTSREVAKYFHRVTDTRQTTDWSRHNELTLIRKHTKGEGIPVVMYSFSTLDEDVNDGSLFRMLTDLMEVVFFDEDRCPGNYSIREYVDFYIYSHLRPHRNEYPVWLAQGEEQKRYSKGWSDITEECWNEIYEKFPNKKPVTLALNISSSHRPGPNIIVSGNNSFFSLVKAAASNNDEDFADYGAYGLKEKNFFYVDIYKDAEAFKHLLSEK